MHQLQAAAILQLLVQHQLQAAVQLQLHVPHQLQAADAKLLQAVVAMLLHAANQLADIASRLSLASSEATTAVQQHQAVAAMQLQVVAATKHQPNYRQPGGQASFGSRHIIDSTLGARIV